MMDEKSKVIKDSIIKGFKNGNSKIANRGCYGYVQDAKGKLVINEREAIVARWIFERYISGHSLGKIADALLSKGICSPTCRTIWNREAIDKLLSNEKYTGDVVLQKTVVQKGKQVVNNEIAEKYTLHDSHPAIISMDLFIEVQHEKARRSNIVRTESGTQRKVIKYNSGNAPSGLLICSECGSTYRRITRNTKGGKEIVWRCGNRVEHGNETCKKSPTVSDAFIKEYIYRELKLFEFDEEKIRKKIDSINVRTDGTLSVIMKIRNRDISL